MASVKLTDGVVESVRANGADRYLWDTDLRRFGVRITPKGERIYLIQYRVKLAAGEPSRTRKISIGRHGAQWNVTRARAEARKLLAPVDLGRDPFGERLAALEARAAENAAEAEAAQRVAAAEAERQARRFEVVLERYIAAALTDTRSGPETARLLRHGPAAHWQGWDVGAIKRADVAELIDVIRKRSPSTARLTYAFLRSFFRWCIERDLIEASPCDHIKAPPRPKARDRVLSDAELRAIWRASESLEFPFGPLIQLLILTGQRRSEVAGMAWPELDLKAGVWRLPRERSKNGKAHEIDLGPEALAILEALPRAGKRLFPARRAPIRKGAAAGERPEDPGAVRGFSATKRRLDELAAADGLSEPWRLHDLRRTAATGMAAANVPPHVIERVLNHVSGAQGGLVAVYQRFDYRAERKAALLAWGERVAAIISADDAPQPPAEAPASNVVRLRA